MFLSGLLSLSRPSRALSGLALILCVALQFPALLLWPFMSDKRRTDVLSMVEALTAWAQVNTSGRCTCGQRESAMTDGHPDRASPQAIADGKQPVGPPSSRPPRSRRAKAAQQR